MAVLFEIFFDFERGHAACARGGDGLAIASVLHVAACKDAGDTREHVVAGLDVAVLVEIDLAVKHFGVGFVADAEEETRNGQLAFFVGVGVAQGERADRFFFDAQHVFDDGVGADFNFGVSHGASEHDLAGAEAVATMEQVNLRGKAGEKERLFHGRVAAADDSDFLVAEEESVAGGATGDAVPDERLFIGKTEPARACAGGDDQRARAYLTRRRLEPEGMDTEIGGDQMGGAELGAKAGGLLLHVLDQFGPLNALGPAGKVLDQSGDGKLSTGFVAFEHKRLEVGARGIDGGGKASATGAEDYGIAGFGLVACWVACSVLFTHD
uniref:Uncharacterized protein n=1 Tax=mine drainage metagenome TaxID=410659 RepID=E6Q0D3_9ZZZZ